MPKELKPDSRTRLLSWRDAIADTDLPPHVKLVAFVLSLHMNRQGASCFPGTKTVMQQATLGRSAVLQHIKTLETTGWLTSEVASGRGGPRAYTASFPADVRQKVGRQLIAEPSAQPDSTEAVEPSAQPDSSEAPKSPTVHEPSTNRPPSRTPLTKEDERTRGRNESSGFDLAPYIDLHVAITGGIAPAGEMATTFKELEERGVTKHPEAGREKIRAKILRHQENYLRHLLAQPGGGQFLSYAKFGQTFSSWAASIVSGPGRRRAAPAAPDHTKDFAEGLDDLGKRTA